jgi:hypothetical protein
MLKEKDTKSPPLSPTKHTSPPPTSLDCKLHNLKDNKDNAYFLPSFLPSFLQQYKPVVKSGKKYKKPSKQTTTRGVYNNIKRKSRPRFLERGAKLAERPTRRRYKRFKPATATRNEGERVGTTQRNATLSKRKFREFCLASELGAR